ncbi:hypothetical protein O159_13860 [Leifsonia xyli subsp. cynodontis DSM 46306]|uniref:AB hydrolase-1 domain-containing protein n=1 Tax=Leifsonia xyli subsp. cynodontis DSM 46306 TaxID=1389489 RepID=U3P979_LEIXC|nr:alpha/beta hydrolase [Leifsonia xyli]AGW41452.1 hypothetical protein O159_13860 [Leifsonia xyli subsp. cynodontis DSM 46306]
MSFLQTPYGRLAYTDHGGAGTPVLALHGFLLGQKMFDHQVQRLSEFRWITVDSFGHGAADDGCEGFTFWYLARYANEILRVLDVEKAFWAGMSQGGFIGLRGALAYPESVQGLILISTETRAASPESFQNYYRTSKAWSSSGPSSNLLDQIAANLFDGYREYWGEWQDLWRSLPWQRLDNAAQCVLERDDLTPRLGDISCPALVVVGEEDHDIAPDIQYELSDKLPGSRAPFVVPGGTHAVNVTHPEAVNERIREYIGENR